MRKHFQSKDFKVGDKFKIIDSPYSKELYVVKTVSENSIGCENVNWHDDKIHSFGDANLYYWGEHVQIIERASDNDAINAVSVRLTGESLGKGEKEFVKTQNALEKAVTEFRENKTIQFENGRLTFVSRDSGEQRNVTKFGCSRECICGNGMSYHKVLYAICEQVAKGVSLPKSDSQLFGVSEKRAA